MSGDSNSLLNSKIAAAATRLLLVLPPMVSGLLLHLLDEVSGHQEVEGKMLGLREVEVVVCGIQECKDQLLLFQSLQLLIQPTSSIRSECCVALAMFQLMNG